MHYTDLLPLLRQIDPPLGFGSKCPDLLAYKRLVRMNMPVDEEGKEISVVDQAPAHQTEMRRETGGIFSRQNWDESKHPSTLAGSL